jgi:glycine betaine/proline transport system substrate-binding protein
MVNGGETYEGGPQFFMIPLWVHEQYNLNTIDDMLNAETAKLFQDPEDSDKGYFINCAIGWQCAEINRAKAKTYGLDDYYNIITPGTAAAMDAAYHGAQKKENPIFGYYWAPTSLMGMYDWYILEEPENTPECWAEVIKGRDDATYTPAEACAYETLPVSKGMNSGLAAKAPEVSAMLNKMNTGLQPINVTAAWSVENEIQDYEKVAIYYLNNYEDRWATWMPADKVAKVKAALANES